MSGPFRPNDERIAGCRLRRVTADETPCLARILAAMEPWAGLGYGADALDRWLGRHDPALTRLVAVNEDGSATAVMALRYPWLRGPYLELLAVLPDHQGHGLGGALMTWATTRSRAVAENLWACVSDFNTDARAFYAAQGFAEAGRLEDLVTAGRSELLLRRRL